METAEFPYEFLWIRRHRTLWDSTLNQVSTKSSRCQGFRVLLSNKKAIHLHNQPSLTEKKHLPATYLQQRQRGLHQRVKLY